MGVREVQFNVIGAEELQLKTGYLGLTIAYGTQHETLPFIQDTSDLEYQLTTNIKKLKDKTFTRCQYSALKHIPIQV